jgi:SPP1 family predicted phage head-tail adaptor
MQQDEPQAQVTHQVRIRRRSGITPEMRVIWQGRVLNVRAITSDHTDRRWQLLWCEERVGETT